MRLPAPSHAYSLLWEVLSAAAGGRREVLSPGKALAKLEAHFAERARPGGGRKRCRGQCVVLVADEIDYLVTPNQACGRKT